MTRMARQALMICMTVITAVSTSAGPAFSRAVRTHTLSTNSVKQIDKARKSGKRPKVLFFYANWAKPCQMIKPVIESTQNKWKDRVDFVSIDVDDPENAKLVEQYEVAPVPTVVFLKGNGKIGHLTIGYSNADEVKAGLKDIVPQG